MVALTSATDGSFSLGPKWSPDSAELLFQPGSSDDYLTGLWLIDVDDSDLFQVADSLSGYASYAFAPEAG